MKHIQTTIKTLEHLNLVADLLFQLQQAYSKIVVITEPDVCELHGTKIFADLPDYIYLTVPNGEKAKCVSVANQLWQQMVQLGVDRHSVVVSFGGGAISDLSGFVASCFMRGIDLIHIPTTLLSMVDASIGGKTGINLNGKNLIGTFYPANETWICTKFLETLPIRQIRSGLSEIVKYGMIWDEELFNDVEQHAECLLSLNLNKLGRMIKWSIEIKQSIVDQDLQDRGIRATLNYGHTFAHAIEQVSEYKQYSHGEAVAIGMHLAAETSQLLGHASHQLVERQKKLLQILGLPVALNEMPVFSIFEAMKTDKKSVNGKITLILPEKVGKVIQFVDVDKSLIEKVLRKNMLIKSNTY